MGRGLCLGCKNPDINRVARGRCLKCLKKTHGGACTVPGCPFQRCMKGPDWALCAGHRKAKRSGNPDWYRPLRRRNTRGNCVYCEKNGLTRLADATKLMCNMHYQRARTGVPMDVPRFKAKKHQYPFKVCTAPNCMNKRYKSGLCSGHTRRPNMTDSTPWVKRLKPGTKQLLVAEVKRLDTPIHIFIAGLVEKWASAHVGMLRAKEEAARVEQRRIELSAQLGSGRYMEGV